jgi:hypothetical protein
VIAHVEFDGRQILRIAARQQSQRRERVVDRIAERAIFGLVLDEVLEQLGENPVRLRTRARISRGISSVLLTDIEDDFLHLAAAHECERELSFAVAALAFFEQVCQFRDGTIGTKDFLAISVAVFFFEQLAPSADDEVANLDVSVCW